VQTKNKTVVEFTNPSSPTGGKPQLAPGDSVALVYTANATKLDDFPDGAMATLQTKDGYQTSFAVAKP
jgi:hypothetical protein